MLGNLLSRNILRNLRPLLGVGCPWGARLENGGKTVIYKFVGLSFGIQGSADGNCFKKLHELDRLGKLPRYCHIDIFHDPQCGFLKGKPCDCDPVVEWQEIKVL